MSRGADPTALNVEGKSSVDIGGSEIFEQNDDENPSGDVNVMFLEAARSGDIDTVKRLCNSNNVNCRDMEGRHSTPLHFAAGYNRVQVVEYLLSQSADVQGTVINSLIKNNSIRNL